ncbi:unnamed protein product, partial [Sphacelaria rigidula]
GNLKQTRRTSLLTAHSGGAGIQRPSISLASCDGRSYSPGTRGIFVASSGSLLITAQVHVREAPAAKAWGDTTVGAYFLCLGQNLFFCLHLIQSTTDEICESAPGLYFQSTKNIPNELANED